jgi:hypothetical protein
MKRFLALLLGCAILGIGTAGMARAEECGGPVTADEALAAEDDRYEAQTTNDFAAMEKLFGSDLVMRSGAVKYRTMRRSGVTVRTYGCIAILSGQANFDVTVKGQDLSVELRFHTVWAKRDGGLQFVSWQATRVPAPQ